MNVDSWTDLTAAEPRLAAVLEASLSLVGTSDHCHAEAVYVMAKPLIGWLTGHLRGTTPRVARDVPAGSRLWAMNTVARPFEPESSLLDTNQAYVCACSHINEYLHQAQLRQEAA